ncbi:MAG TPA: hypothetical protein VGR62_04480 [Candidatus Binatia bacterium]|nr:hypothetical protein [Candidatus Binatia bacterium]
MTLDLFTVFHLNLDFSCIPPGDVPRVLDRCVWPLVELTARPGVRLGLELPADSLERIAADDPLLLDAIRASVARGALEIVGSGLAQVILPLVPAAVGARTLARGQDVYRRRLGQAPRLGYLNEQTWSAGLVPLYREAGFEAIVAEWENPASAHGWPERDRYHAAWVAGPAGDRIACLWNSSVVFQRVQRYAHGEIELDEVLALLATHHDATTPRALCLYGNDAEVFDYRPGAASLRYDGGPRGEWARLETLLRTLVADGRFTLVTPSAALASHPPDGPSRRLESSDAPLPAKKQAKYNVTRWAVCGRDNVRRNAASHGMARRLGLVSALQRASGVAAGTEAAVGRLADEVVRLWGSDLRTHTTDERTDAAAARAGAVASEIDALVARLEPALVTPALAPDELALFNPHPTAWTATPVAFPVRFAPGVVRGGLRVEAAGRELPSQLEEVETYRDGSIRAGLLVVAPHVPPLGTLRLRCRSAAIAPAPGDAPDRIETGAVVVQLTPRRGAAVRALTFPRLAPHPLAGTIAQGAFSPIELAADWYTGNVVLHDAVGAKHTDLEATTLVALAAPEACPIRIPVAARVAGPWGEVWKTIYVYRDVPRLDVRYHFTFRDLRPRSLRAGVLSLDPTAFRPDALRYVTVNGGRDVERFGLGTTRVAQHEPVSFAVSARSCLGATEGWVDVGDDTHGITVAYDPAALAAAPLMQHTPAGDVALTRVHLSLAESDDTAAPLFRGHTRFTVRWLGRGTDMTEARRQAVHVAEGLHVVRPADAHE